MPKFQRVLYATNKKVDSRGYVYLDELTDDEAAKYLEANPEIKRWLIDEDYKQGSANNVITKPKQKRSGGRKRNNKSDKSE